jgi:hypothetical protein
VGFPSFSHSREIVILHLPGCHSSGKSRIPLTWNAAQRKMERIRMKFMIAWKIQPGCYKAAVERFLSTGAPDPSGLKTIALARTKFRIRLARR